MADGTRDADRGFTLIEVMVVAVLLGLITAVIAFAITTVLRVTPVAESQVTNARSIQGLTAWFSSDAASVVPDDPDGVNLTSPLKCANSEASPGANLVEFRWTAAEPSTTTFVAAYRLEPSAAGHSVYRYECSGSGSPPYSATTTQKLTGPLSDFNNVTWTTSPPRIGLELRALDGTAIGLEATPRSPDDTLPTTTVPATVVPPDPCTVTFDSTGYIAGRIASGPEIDELDRDIDIDVTIGGDTCGTLTIEYSTGYETKSREITWSGTTGSVRIPMGDSTADTPQWTPITHPITIHNNGAPLDSPSNAYLSIS